MALPSLVSAMPPMGLMSILSMARGPRQVRTMSATACRGRKERVSANLVTTSHSRAARGRRLQSCELHVVRSPHQLAAGHARALNAPTSTNARSQTHLGGRNVAHLRLAAVFALLHGVCGGARVAVSDCQKQSPARSSKSHEPHVLSTTTGA